MPLHAGDAQERRDHARQVDAGDAEVRDQGRSNGVRALRGGNVSHACRMAVQRVRLQD
jgi:hypothetical protein